MLLILFRCGDDTFACTNCDFVLSSAPSRPMAVKCEFLFFVVPLSWRMRTKSLFEPISCVPRERWFAGMTDQSELRLLGKIGSRASRKLTAAASHLGVMDCTSGPGCRIKVKKISRNRASTTSSQQSTATTTGVNGSRLKQLTARKKHTTRSRKCVCSPSNYALVEFPSVLSELRTNQQLCDGAVKCAMDQMFPVHRVILSAVSPYFKTLFTSSLKGGKSEINQVSISNVSADIFRLIIDYAYTGTCNVTSENVEQLLPVADQFEVLGVVQLCCRFLLQELRPDNCLGIFKFARHYFCRDLADKGHKYICHNFKQIVLESEEFKDLEADELAAILRDDELNVKNEEIVFEAIKAWIESGPKERLKSLANLLECVRFGLMSYKYFTHNVLAWKSIDENDECYEKILSPANAYLADQEERQKKAASISHNDIDLRNPLTRPRIPYEVLFAVGGWIAESPTSFVETYDTRADKWFLSSNTDSTPRSYHGMCALNNLIYIIGGFNGHEHFNTVRCFDPVSKDWRERACMYHARCYVSVCTHAGKIYALGGFNGRTRMSSGERYDPQRNQWEMIPSMHTQRSDAGAASLNDKIYIVGGFNGIQIFSSAEVFDVEANQWTYIRSMSDPRTGVSLVAFRNSLYALGGFDGTTRLSSGERYSPHQGVWHGISEMCCPRSNFATVVLDDMIFVVGGFNGSEPIAYVECYDPESNEWYDASPMNLNRSALGACVIAGLENAREYSYVKKAGNNVRRRGNSKNRSSKSSRYGNSSEGRYTDERDELESR